MPNDQPGLLRRIGTGVRNTIQRIPGGSRAFPTEANGTVNWLGNPFSGNNVLGAMVRGASGYDAMADSANMIRGLTGGGRPSVSSAGASGTPGVGRPGSVVARGFIGASSGSARPSAGLPQVNAIHGARNAGVPRLDGSQVIERTDPQRDPRIGSGQALAPTGGGSTQQRSSGLLGAGQRFGSQLAFADMYEAQHRRADAER